MRRGSFFNEGKQKIGQDEMTKVVCGKLSLNTLGRELIVGVEEKGSWGELVTCVLTACMTGETETACTIQNKDVQPVELFG